MIERLVSGVAAIGGAILLSLSASAALADKRVALVVGNSAYQTVAQLPNPSKDAKSIAKLLKDAGFDYVDLQQDVGNLDFKRAIRKFEDVARDADIAVVFYAGHGIELGGINYMIPVDAKLASDRDAQDEAISLDRITDAVEFGEAIAPRHSGCMPGQSVRHFHETGALREPLDKFWSRQDRATGYRYADRLCGEGRVDGG